MQSESLDFLAGPSVSVLSETYLHQIKIVSTLDLLLFYQCWKLPECCLGSAATGSFYQECRSVPCRPLLPLLSFPPCPPGQGSLTVLVLPVLLLLLLRGLLTLAAPADSLRPLPLLLYLGLGSSLNATVLQLLVEYLDEPGVQDVLLWLPGAVLRAPSLPFDQVFGPRLTSSLSLQGLGYFGKIINFEHFHFTFLVILSAANTISPRLFSSIL